MLTHHKSKNHEIRINYKYFQTKSTKNLVLSEGGNCRLYIVCCTL
jgi:hypothetical protein